MKTYTLDITLSLKVTGIDQEQAWSQANQFSASLAGIVEASGYNVLFLEVGEPEEYTG